MFLALSCKFVDFQSKLYVSETSEESEYFKEAYENYLKLEKKLLTELGLHADPGDMDNLM